MKYIIDVPDGTKWIEAYYAVDHFQYQGQTTIVDSLIPYTEPDRKAIEDEVWELADYMGRMSLTERDLCFGFPLPQEVTMNLSYNEAKDKFEAWLKQKDEIHVGDEVENASHKKGIVFNNCISPSNGLKYVRVLYIDDDGNSFISAWEKNGVKKTGRHFDEVGQMLEKMRGESE